MLLYFPLVFFLVSFFFVYRKNGFDMASFILLAYSATSLASIFLADADLYYNVKQLSIVPVLLHCFFTLALTYPFVRFNSNKKRSFSPIQNVQLFNTICTVFIVLFFVMLIATFPIVISRLRASDAELASIRAAAYQGEISVDYTMGFLPHWVESIMNILSVGSMCMLVFFFYSICFMNKTKLFSVLLLISSMSALIYSIITVDRSKLFFWLLLFLMSFFLFKPYLPKSQKKFVFSIMAPVFLFFVLYFITVTVARFGDSDMGSEGSALSYAGQSLFNLCYLWDNVPGNSVNFRGVFPLTYYILFEIFGIRLSFGPGVYNIMALSDLNGFNALVGYGVREVGQIPTVILLVILVFVISVWIKHYSKSDIISLNKVMIVFLLGTIVVCGFIAYYYSSWPHALMFWLFVFLTKRIH